MKKGFTLAEVLITLAIIGVVAALTIPTVVHKYQQKQMYTQFMKLYNTLSTTLSLSVAKNGDPLGWSCNDISEEDFYDTYLAPYLSGTQKTTLGSVYSSVEKFNDLKGGTFMNVSDISSFPGVILPDGSTLFIANKICDSHANIIVLASDTNGAKGPNTLGRDLFILTYGTFAYAPHPMFEKPGISIATDYNQDIEACCSTTGECPNDSAGVTCPLKLVKDGKMDY